MMSYWLRLAFVATLVCGASVAARDASWLPTADASSCISACPPCKNPPRCLARHDSCFDTEVALWAQPHAVTQLKQLFLLKIANPDRLLVLLLAGASGVGKSHFAHLLSRYMRREGYGGGLIEFSANSTVGLSPRDVRSMIVPPVLAHLRQHPHGVVVINDLHLFDPDVIDVIWPLLAGKRFIEDYWVNLRKATVIVTIDLDDTAEATESMSADEIRSATFQRLVRMPFVGRSLAETFEIVPFLPWDMDALRHVLEAELLSMPCRYPDVVASVSVKREVIDALVAQVAGVVRTNGRRAKQLLNKVEAELICTLNNTDGRGRRDIRVKLNPDGDIDVEASVSRPTPLGQRLQQE